MGDVRDSGAVPEAFRRATDELRETRWRPEFVIDDMPAPQRIAPHAMAISADVVDDDDVDIANGRLILLHDPAGNDAWAGTFRLVTFARATLDAEMVADPLLNPVGWSWLTEPLELRQVPFSNPSGTVTSVSSQSFGQLDHEPQRAEMEIRASWTPELELDGSGLSGHVAAWQDLLCTMAGLPPVPDSVVMINRRRSAR